MKSSSHETAVLDNVEPPSWNTFYVLDPTRLNGAIPPLYVFMVVGLSVSVDRPALLFASCIMVALSNVGLAVWVQRYGQAVTPFQRVEAVRLVINALVDGALIIAYVDEAPVWCLALTGALIFSTIWTGRSALKAYAVHLLVLVGAMSIAGQPLGATVVMVSTYWLCARITVFFMAEVKKTVKEREEASSLALAFRKEQYNRDMADHRRKALASTHQLASSLAHEVNNPLFAVTGNLHFAQELLDEALDATSSHAVELREVLADANSAAATISQIIEQMRSLNHSRTRARSVLADLSSAVEDALRQIEPRIASNIRVERNFESTPPVLVHPSQISQIVFNLVLNASDAMVQTSPADNVIRVSISTDAVGRATVSVQDTGKGIPTDSLVRIFTPFYTTRPGVGSGLGLMVVHSIVEDTGGRIDVESELGKGSTFKVSFPIVESDAGQSPAVAVRGKTTRKRLLIIDDDRGVARMLTRSLRGHDTVACHSTAEADRILAEDDSFDLVLSDVVMPKESGIDWFDRVVPTIAGIGDRVVFLSGGALDLELRERITASGCPLLVKPVEIQDLLDLIATRGGGVAQGT